jgi:hypothetical protein
MSRLYSKISHEKKPTESRDPHRNKYETDQEEECWLNVDIKL